MQQAEYLKYQENTVITPEQIRAFELANQCSIYINDLDFGLGKLYISMTDEIKAQTWNLPKKKLIDLPYIQGKFDKLIERDTSYENLRATFEKLKIEGDIYYTSFGFSYDMFMKNDAKFKADTAKIEQALKDLNIEFSTEFSDAFWVLRYRISKKQSNIERIKNLK